MMITERCKTTSGLIQFCKEIKQQVEADGERFWWAPVGCDENQMNELAKKGYYVIQIGSRVGIGWSKKRRGH